MKASELRERAFAMPFTSPAFPPGPYRFIDREFLVREHRRALAGEATADCRLGSCQECGVCPAFGVEPRLVKRGAENWPKELT